MQRYLNKVSGPLLDRIDLHVEVTPVDYDELLNYPTSTIKSSDIRQRVIKARLVQQTRFEHHEAIHANSQMGSNEIRKYVDISNDGREMLKMAMKRLNLSARAYDRILKVARTIADLENSVDVQNEHLAEAIQYRSLDRGNWAG